MEFLDFELRIGAGRDSEYPVTVVHSPEGEASGTARLPIKEPDFVRNLEMLEEICGLNRGIPAANTLGRNLGTVELSRANKIEVAKEVGRKLFESLFLPGILGVYRSSLASSRKDGKGLRLRLRIEASELAALPWEFLYDEVERDYVCLLRETPLTRYLELIRPTQNLIIQPPIRILGMVASPNNLLRLDVSLERERIAEAMNDLRDRGDVELTWVEGGTCRSLQATLSRRPWHIFHFIGHGSFDHDSGEGQVQFCDDAGCAHPVSALQFGRLFGGHTSLRLAVVNACEGARISESSLYSSVGAVLMQRGIPAVISMQYAISDRAALEFSRVFYDALARGEPVDIAVTEARIGIDTAVANTVEWATPVLHMRSPDGHVFDLDKAGMIFAPDKIAAGESIKMPHTGTSPHQPSVSSDRWQLDTGDDKHKHDREILLRRVKQFWINDVLENSLFNKTMIELGIEVAPDAVKNPWTTMIERRDARARPLQPSQTITDVFDEEGGSLLILGEPGSGKTTSLLGLARTLIARAEDQPSRPVPVVFKLSNWSESCETLLHWMAAELSDKYQMHREIGKALLEAGRILPLLDGLDELNDVARRAACVSTINEYTLEASSTGTVVCCRFRDYVELPNRLVLNKAVRLVELRDDQVRDYLIAGGDGLSGLRTAINRDFALRLNARSPLMLNLMARAYSGLSEEQIEYENEGTAATRRHEILDAYVKRMFHRARTKIKQVPYNETEITSWLAWLARGMQNHGHTVFEIDQLQPSWLAQRFEVYAYLLLTRIIWGLFSAVMIGLALEVLLVYMGSAAMVVALGLLSGLMGAMIFGAIDLLRFRGGWQTNPPNGPWRVFLLIGGLVISGLVGGLIMGLLVIFVVKTDFDLVLALYLGILCGLIFGLFFGSIWTTRSLFRPLKSAIQPIEVLKQDWSRSLPMAIAGLIVGLVTGAVVGLILALAAQALSPLTRVLASGDLDTARRLFSMSTGDWMLEGLVAGPFVYGHLIPRVALSAGLMFGVVGAVVGGSRPAFVEAKILPNEGILRSRRRAIRIGALFGVVAGLLLGLVTQNLAVGLASGIMVGMTAGLLVGGLEVIDQGVLRLIIVTRRYSPPNYVQLLDFATTELAFLQTVGGGYMFIHHYLLEYFAAIGVVESSELASRTQVGSTSS